MLTITIDNNLCLKIVQPPDAKAIFNLIESNREELHKWMPWEGLTKSVVDVEGFIERSTKEFEEGQNPQCAIWYQDKIVGLVGLHQISWPNRRVSMGYWLDKEYRGQGIVSRSVAGLLRVIFTEKKLNKVTIQCATENIKSRAIPERLGFKHEGTLRDHEWLYDHFVDHECYSLLLSEWESLQA